MDLSYNGMGDQCGSMFAKVLRVQAEMRDQHIWMSSLRKGCQRWVPETVGLKEFHLKFNKLGAGAAKALCQMIEVDEYMRVLDLRGNFIPEEVVRDHLIPSLKFNNTLTNVDIRENPGYVKSKV